jgi:hypothetical protein
MKRCFKCGETKPLLEFYKDKAARDGHKKKCKVCVNTDSKKWALANREAVYAGEKRRRDLPTGKIRTRGYNLKRTYGITLAEYRAMEFTQGGRCLICQEIPTPALNRVPLYVDHNHRTGAVRALLCKDCNTGLGHLRDNPSLLTRAAAYLEIFQ